jgi:hypothetical protein
MRFDRDTWPLGSCWKNTRTEIAAISNQRIDSLVGVTGFRTCDPIFGLRRGAVFGAVTQIFKLAFLGCGLRRLRRPNRVRRITTVAAFLLIKLALCKFRQTLWLISGAGGFEMRRP